MEKDFLINSFFNYSGNQSVTRSRRSMGQPSESAWRHCELLPERDRLGAGGNDGLVSRERRAQGNRALCRTPVAYIDAVLTRATVFQEEIQKLAARIEFMKIVHMEMHNRHIKPKMGGYFSTHGHGHGHPTTGQSPIAKSSTASFILRVCI